MATRIFDLDERLIDFSVAIITLSEQLPDSIAGKHLCGQITRSGTAPALQYAEAQAAESPPDFIHKMKISLKELRETYAALRIIKKKGWCAGELLQNLLRENNELISIFVTSVKTAQRNAGISPKRSTQPS